MGPEYTTIAEEYSGRSRLYSAGKRESGSGGTGSWNKGELMRWLRLLICAAIFLALVVTKVQMPEHFAQLRSVFSAQMEQSMDYREVFSAVGKAVSGEATVRDALNEVYLEVFRPEQREDNQAVETAASSSFSSFSQQEPVNALLAFPQHWGDGSLLLRQETTDIQKASSAETEASESAAPSAVPETEKTVSEPSPVYSTENLPAGVSMEQQQLGLDYTAPVSGWISSEFGYREHPIEGDEKFHRGIDIAAAEGTAIVAFADGTVKATGESSSLGKYVMISHSGDLTTIYGHCSKITANSGSKVKKGEKIAEVGHTGLATGSHLHFAMQQGGNYLNPVYYVQTQSGAS